MVTLIFSDGASTRVEYKTDLVDIAKGNNFTVMEVNGLSDAEIVLGINFRQLPYGLAEFKQFAEDNALELSAIGNNDTTPTVLVELPEES